MATTQQSKNDVHTASDGKIDQSESSVTRRLDDMERSLPPIPAKAVALGRAGADRIGTTTGDIARDIGRHVSRVTTVAGDAINTSVGQTRSAFERTAAAVRHNTNEAIGQTRAQTKRTGRAAEDGAVALLDDATRAVTPGVDSPAALEEWSKADLYDRAQELDIQGRSSMDKHELIDAIRAA